MASNFWTVSCRILIIFSWAMIQDIFRLAWSLETVDCFHAFAIVILAPRRIKWTRLFLLLEAFSIGKFSSAMWGDIGTDKSIVFLMIAKILFQNPLSFGHSHQTWIMVPVWLHPLKHRGEVEGYHFASLAGTKYHLVRTFRSASIRDTLSIPRFDHVITLCHSSSSHSCLSSLSQANIQVVLECSTDSDSYITEIPPLLGKLATPMFIWRYARW